MYWTMHKKLYSHTQLRVDCDTFNFAVAHLELDPLNPHFPHTMESRFCNFFSFLPSPSPLPTPHFPTPHSPLPTNNFNLITLPPVTLNLFTLLLFLFKYIHIISIPSQLLCYVFFLLYIYIFLCNLQFCTPSKFLL